MGRLVRSQANAIRKSLVETACLVAVAALCVTGCSGDNEPSITVTSPNGEVSWPVGSEQEITWTSEGVETVRIEVSRDGGETWEEVAASVDAVAGSYAWTVTDGGGAGTQVHCLVSVSDTSDGGPSDVSDAAFTVHTPVVLRVKLGATAGGNGLTWDSAFEHPQDATDASLPGDEIWVAAGTYTRRGAADKTLLTMKDGVAVYGGFAGDEATRDARNPETNVTTLDGEDYCYHVVVGASNATLDGATVTRGFAINMRPNGLGGGMLNLGVSNLIVSDCKFSDNFAFGSDGGGGMYNESSSLLVIECAFIGNSREGVSNREVSDLSIESCTFAGNGNGIQNHTSSPTVTGCTFADNSNSGVRNVSSFPVVTGCTFSGNSRSGMENCESSPTITDCTFTGNVAYDDGGAIMNFDSSPEITDSTFTGNTGEKGGAISSSYDSHTVIRRCTFSANSATENGGAIFNGWGPAPTVENCVFSGNAAGLDGGGVYSIEAAPTLTNCTFTGNSAGGYGGGLFTWDASPTLTSCILWGDTAGTDGAEVYDKGTAASAVIYSCVQGGWLGEGNIGENEVDHDPLFVTAGSWDDQGTPETSDDVWTDGDYHLQDTSPCIDTGDPATTLSEDIEGSPRPAGSGYDLGAYEYQ